MRIFDSTLVTDAVVEPIGLQEAKEHLRVDHDDDDAWLLGAIPAVRQRMEDMAHRALVSQTREAVLGNWPADRVVVLPRPPLISVTSVKYTDEDGVEATLDASNYLVDTRSTPGRIVFKTTAVIPSVTLREVDGIVIRYVAGYGAAASDVPEIFKRAMLLWLGELYENRENSAAGGLVTVPNAAEKLVLKYRVP